VIRETSKNLDKDPFSSLPLKMRIGLLLLTIGYIMGYLIPPALIYFAGMKKELAQGLVKGGVIYGLSWIVGGLGLFLAGKDSIKYPIYFFAKLLKHLFPTYFDVENGQKEPISMFVVVNVISVLLLLVFGLLAWLRYSIYWLMGIAAVVLIHQGLYTYGMFAPRAEYFFKTIQGKEFFNHEKGFEKGVLFRFDDGPDPVYTPRILDILKEESICALFAVTGENVAKYPEIVKRMHAENHIIGNHTHSHPYNMLLLGYKKLRYQIQKTNDAIAAVTGVVPEYFCPPIGQKNPVMGKIIKELNLKPIMWDIRTADTHLSTKQIMRIIHRKFTSPSIILFHDAVLPWSKKDRESTVESLILTIRFLKDNNHI